jgi:hypothetical protein
MNGVLKLPALLGKHYTVIGGAYSRKLPGTVGVKMAREINAHCDIDIPTKDFCTPEKEWLDRGLLQAVEAILAGKPVYVGCYAGKGRTGLFLAVLAKAFGIDHPVEYVRAHYYPHAVETAEQYKFVTQYAIPEEVKRRIFLARIKSIFTFKKSLTNLPSAV